MIHELQIFNPRAQNPRHFLAGGFEYRREPCGRMFYRRPGEDGWNYIGVVFDDEALEKWLQTHPNVREIQ